MQHGPADSLTIAQNVLGLSNASSVVADRVAVALLGADPRIRKLCDGRWSLVQVAWGSPQLANCTFAVVDVETTGSHPGMGDRIVEIAIVAVSGNDVEMVFESLINPGRSIPRVVESLTGITVPMVRERPLFDDVADEIIGVLAGRIFAAHNVRFDWRFVGSELWDARDVRLDGPRVCTVDLTRRFVPGLRRRNLDSVADYFGVEIQQRHRAGADAMATARVLQKLIELAIDRGAKTLEDLRRIGRRRKRGRKRGGRAMPRSVDEI